MAQTCAVNTFIFIQKQQINKWNGLRIKIRKKTYGTCSQTGINVDGEESQKQTLSKERASTGKHDRKINMSPKSVKYILEKIFTPRKEFITFYVIYRFIIWKLMLENTLYAFWKLQFAYLHIWTALSYTLYIKYILSQSI